MPLADAVSSHVMESMCNDSICDDGTHVDIHIKDRCKTRKLHGSRMKLFDNASTLFYGRKLTLYYN